MRRKLLLDYMDMCRLEVANNFAAICDAMGCSTPLPRGGPRIITPIFLLERLSRAHRAELSAGWLRCLVDYAVSLTALQRSERLVMAADDEKKLERELVHVGHENWDPAEFPDWLLFEVESGVLIRPAQKRMASSMMEPPGRRNYVMQLDMGEGKSSVIIPIVAAELGDGSRLVRVVVAKPQSRQMRHTLTRALGGLLNRRVCWLPFLRGLQATGDEVGHLINLCREWAADGSLILAQPEHILSLKLLCVEAALSRSPVANSLLALRHYLRNASRDIVDESDENFNIKNNLIYTIGSPKPINFGSLRWRLIQNVLEVAAEVAAEMYREHPEELEFKLTRDGRFPTIRIFDEAGATIFSDGVCRRICNGGLGGFPYTANQTPDTEDATVRYMLDPWLAGEEATRVEARFRANGLLEALLLLRGLVAHQLLSFTLRQRWRVNYGRAYNRQPPTGLAVPYRAKDIPAPRSQFSHPDVTVILTCLSYYYGGLSDDELFSMLRRLYSLGAEGEREYLAWMESAPGNIVVPSTFRRLDAIDLEDSKRCIDAVFPHLRHLKPAVDYYLSDILFPKEMKEYSQTLSESAWSMAEAKPEPTTGFSGTSDSKYLLPLGIRPLDLEEFRHTNISVLNRLLHPDNKLHNISSAISSPFRRDALPARELLHHIASYRPQVRAIIDVGAQILELNNTEAAHYWLTLTPAADASAVIFFNADELCVVTRDGNTELFLTSPYITNMAACLVFLDGAHTRGTDLPMPDDYRAAVTLGPALTKDQLAQACMRMRQLGRGQSVVFFMSAEIRRKVATFRGMSEEAEIKMVDVLSWSVGQTWQEFRRLMPLWATQGLRHQRRQILWDRAHGGSGYDLNHQMSKEFLENGAKTLQEWYGPGDGQGQAATLAREIRDAALAPRQTELARIQRQSEVFGVHGLGNGAFQGLEEQEREISAEVEEVRETSPLPQGEPYKPQLHADVKTFIMTGIIPAGSTAFLPAFQALDGSSVGHFLSRIDFPSGLLVTADFARTVSLPASGVLDTYQRPVQWISSAPTPSNGGDGDIATVAVLSPWEANKLMPIFRAGSGVATLHLFAPRTSLETRSAEDLTLYTTPDLPPQWVAPRTPLMLLLVFAGQLYFRSEADVVGICQLLRVPCRAGENDEGVKEEGVGSTFNAINAVFLQELLKQIRYKGTNVSRTDIGRILMGDLLPSHIFSQRSRKR
ncbi:hypothetical protein B0T25DRAFT_548396 [Lasiosphaeria hispida]|uniref:ubiquitinyl hydrolase 1 n=1 Tax=Lasiosphaeria hispida TaxID=260671 RepID=A0AAJ0MCF0_9PEZI|nr:hypothetical protein B0T25DRAFT_548396 [Lasiosphaeria hispida]